MSKPILFIDFDGTLCYDRFWRSLKRESDAVGKFLFRENPDVAFAWMTGKLTSEKVNERVAEELNIPYEELWGLFVQDCKTMYISPDTLAAINSLRHHFHTVLITTNMDSLDRFTVPALELDKYFDRIVNPYNEGQLKIDNGGESFRKIISELEAKTTECFLLDDHQDVCNIFSELGGTSYLVSDEKKIDHYLEDLLKNHK